MPNWLLPVKQSLICTKGFLQHIQANHGIGIKGENFTSACFTIRNTPVVNQ